LDLSVVTAALAGIGLAACAGLRAFLPLFAAGLAARFFHWELAPSVDWLSSDWSLVTTGVATILEILADKVPFVDNVLDAIQTFLAPVAGVLVSLTPFFHLSPEAAWVLAIVGGATIAGGVHFLAAAARVKSSAVTAGIGNPVLSFAEDAAAFLSLLLSLLAPILLLLLFVAMGIAFRRLWRRRRRARPSVPARAAGNPGGG
jgi:hypothetical protein